MHVAVIGAGMIGSAAARHLTLMGHEVTLVGPAEPADPMAWDGPFGSHYDVGRITRQMDPWLFWSRASRASIARYRALEAETGIAFFNEVGSLMAGPEGSAYTERLERTRLRDDVPCDILRGAELSERFPWFALPGDYIGYHERHGAGTVDPRAMVAAQIAAAAARGATLLRDVVTDVEQGASGALLKLASGGVLGADRALIATGGFTRALLGEALPFAAYARTAVRFHVSEAEARRLAQMPTLITLLPSGEDPYLLPPLRYPDGSVCLKMGGDPVDIPLLSPADFTEWYRSDGDPGAAQHIEALFRRVMPDVKVDAVTAMPCVTSFTPANIPHYRALSESVFTAFAAGGRGAKNSDELGRLGALLATDGMMPDWAYEPAVDAG